MPSTKEHSDDKHIFSFCFLHCDLIFISGVTYLCCITLFCRPIVVFCGFLFCLSLRLLNKEYYLGYCLRWQLAHPRTCRPILVHSS